MRKHLQKFTPLLLGLIVLGLFSFAPEVLAQDDLIDQTAFEAFAEEGIIEESIEGIDTAPESIEGTEDIIEVTDETVETPSEDTEETPEETPGDEAPAVEATETPEDEFPTEETTTEATPE